MKFDWGSGLAEVTDGDFLFTESSREPSIPSPAPIPIPSPARREHRSVPEFGSGAGGTHVRGDGGGEIA